MKSLFQGRIDPTPTNSEKTLSPSSPIPRSVYLHSPPVDVVSSGAPLSRRLILHPESSFVFAWNIALIGLIVYESFAVPVTIFFGVRLAGVMGYAEFTITLLFLLDIRKLYVVINFNTAFFHGGVFVTNRKSIFEQYFRRW